MKTKAPFPTVSFLDILIHATTMEKTIDWMEACIQDKKPRFLCTMNAALLVWAQKDPFLKKTYQEAALVTCDSTVIYYALKLLLKPVPEPLEACQIMFTFIERRHKKNYRFYFLGAKENILNQAIENLKKQYPGIQIAGYHHGYFSAKQEEEIVQKIVKTKPDCLFIGMSSPLKERFLVKYLEKMGVPICLGVGGGIDILAGKYKLTPSWLRRLGLAWLYRLLLEPKRMWRRYLTTNSTFLWLFFKTWLKRSRS